MTALKRLFVPLDHHDTPATPVRCAVTLARTRGGKLHLSSVPSDCQRDIATEDARGIDPRMADAGHPSHANAEGAASEKCRPIPSLYTLDAVAEELGASEGLSLLELEPLTTVVVRTSHSVYRMTVLDGTTVQLRGGAFPDDTIVRLHGSGFGGHLLRLGWIGVGLRMEFSADAKRFISSAVRAVSIERDPSTYWSQ
jgi:hypothetical protein